MKPAPKSPKTAPDAPAVTSFGLRINAPNEPAINEAKSLEAPKIAAKLEAMKFDVFTGGEGFMRKDDHQFFQPMYIASFGERNDKEPFDEEKTGWGWRVVTKLDTANTMLPTTCRMDRPS